MEQLKSEEKKSKTHYLWNTRLGADLRTTYALIKPTCWELYLTINNYIFL